MIQEKIATPISCSNKKYLQVRKPARIETISIHRFFSILCQVGEPKQLFGVRKPVPPTGTRPAKLQIGKDEVGETQTREQQQTELHLS